MRLNKKNNSGFTLVELIIALSIISIISFAFFTIITSSISKNAKNDKDIKSLNIAQSEIENIRNEIKAGVSLNIYDSNGQSLIDLKDNQEIEWNLVDEEYQLMIKDSGSYDRYIFRDENNIKHNRIITYNRTLDGDPTEYIVKLSLSKQKKKDKDLYDINVSVKCSNEKLSQREVSIDTKVLSK